MVALINEFEQLVRSSRLHTQRREGDDSTTITVEGDNGSAEVDFQDDGQIIGMIDGEVFHSWTALPNNADIRASAKKIRDIIG